MSTKLQFCGLHRIGYNSELDPVCPQCLIARIPPAKHYDFDGTAQKPVDAAGKPLDAAAIVP